jgi:hypothetical protein
MALDLYSEPFQPVGNIDARAAQRAMGRPTLDQWTVFLRETLQNSWDARAGRGGIEFAVDVWSASSDQLEVLRTDVFPRKPKASSLALGEILKSEELGILCVSDVGTRGLTGPTRADRATEERTDFVDFVRNIGRDETRGYGGGTYGFGKSVFYTASACATVLIFTRTEARGRPVSRFMAAALGGRYDDSRGKRYTGRHWWGIESKDTGVEPVTGRAAESLARSLGMARFGTEQMGTSVAVIAPIAYEGETLDQIAVRVAHAASWNAWPHLVGRRPTIRVSFTYEGEEVDRPSPREHPVLKHYVAAYDRAQRVLKSGEDESDWPWVAEEVRSERPATLLGSLAFRSFTAPLVSPDDDPDGPAPISNIALMRGPRLIVRYLPVASHPTGLATAGAFIAAPEHEDQFAQSEPVAHDDWIPENLALEKYQRNVVKQALAKIGSVVRASVRSLNPDSAEAPTQGITRISAALGEMLSAAPGSDLRVKAFDAGSVVGSAGGDPAAGTVGVPPVPGAGATVPSAVRRVRGVSRIELVGDPRVVVLENGVYADFDFDIVGQLDEPICVVGEALVVIDGSQTETRDTAPLGAPTPAIDCWINRDDEALTNNRDLLVDADGPRRWSVRVSQPADTAVTVALRVRRDDSL